MTVTIRLVDDDERLRSARPLTAYAFEKSPSDEELTRRRVSLGRRRTHVLFDDDEPRSTAMVIEMTQNVRGRLLPMGGVAGVATHPAGRRKGFARRLLHHVLADMREHGQVVSALYPFRPSFYERFGYVGIPSERRVTLAPPDLVALMRVAVPGEVGLHRYPEAAPQVRELTEALHPGVHGMALRADPGLAAARGVDDHWVAVATVGGRTVGYLAYQIKAYGGELSAWRFLYRDAAARTLLLGWLAGHTDQIATVSLPLLPDERPETWVTDADLQIGSRMAPLHAPAPMVRILSVPGLAGISVGEAAVSVRVVDEFIGGVYTLDGAGGRLSIRSGGEPTAELTGHGLAALVYGVLDPTELPLRGFGTASPPAVAALRALFGPRTPYLFEGF